MKTTISIMTWINRIIMIPFLISLLISIIDYDYLFYSLYIAFVVGCFQVFSALITLLYFLKLERVKRKLLIIYLISAVLYFVLGYLLVNYYVGETQTIFITIITFSVPVALSIFWTYILETLKRQI
jgi:uncharacterized membrane protein YfcA